MLKQAIRIAAIALAALAATAANASLCFKEAADQYGVPEDVLRAIAKTESNYRADAFNRNSNGTHDIGVMQINSGWLSELATFGIGERELREPCTNIKIGAWILSKNAQALGWNWNAIGAYNVGCKKLSKAECEARRNSYAWKIHTALRRLDGMNAGQATSSLARTPAPSNIRSIMVVRLDESALVEPRNVAVTNPISENATNEDDE